MRKGTKQRTFGDLDNNIQVDYEPDREQVITFKVFEYYPLKYAHISFTKDEFHEMMEFLNELKEGCDRAVD